MIFLEKETDFFELIKNDLVLVDFYATWCGPCRMISPIIDEISKEKEELTIIKVDVDKFPNLASKYGIMSIPTLILFKDGVEVKKNIGFMSKEEIEEFIK